MDNREKRATLDTWHRSKTNKTNNTTQKTKKMRNMDPTKTKWGWIQKAVPVSYYTPSVLYITLWYHVY